MTAATAAAFTKFAPPVGGVLVGLLMPALAQAAVDENWPIATGIVGTLGASLFGLWRITQAAYAKRADVDDGTIERLRADNDRLAAERTDLLDRVEKLARDLAAENARRLMAEEHAASLERAGIKDRRNRPHDDIDGHPV